MGLINMPEEDVFNDDIEVAADIPENPIVNEYLSKIFGGFLIITGLQQLLSKKQKPH